MVWLMLWLSRITDTRTTRDDTGMTQGRRKGDGGDTGTTRGRHEDDARTTQGHTACDVPIYAGWAENNTNQENECINKHVTKHV